MCESVADASWQSTPFYWITVHVIGAIKLHALAVSHARVHNRAASARLFTCVATDRPLTTALHILNLCLPDPNMPIGEATFSYRSHTPFSRSYQPVRLQPS